MSELIISEQHKKAVELNQKIIVSAELAQKNLWDMCVSLKTMRDDKLYKELGYENFEVYCENEVGIKRRQAYSYISIVEKISSDFVQSNAQIGVQKLSLLATISEPEQAEIAEKIDLESTTVKQLKAEIDKLKYKNKNLEIGISAAKRDTSDAQGLVHETSLELERERKRCEKLSDQLDDAQEQIKELENRPIEVAVQESSDNERRLQETIKALEQNNIKHYDELEKQYQEDERAVRQMLEKEKQEALAQLKAEYEQKIAEFENGSTSTNDMDKEIFLMCVSVAHRMLKKVKFYYEKHSSGKDSGWYAKMTSQLKNIFHDVDYPI